MAKKTKIEATASTRREFTIGTVGGVTALLLGGCGGGADDEARRRPDLTTGGGRDLSSGPADLAHGLADMAESRDDLAHGPVDLGDGQVCVVRPKQTEGPYFVDEKLLRSDIRSDPGDGTVKSGAAVRLAFNVARLSGSTCTALADAT